MRIKTDSINYFSIYFLLILFITGSRLSAQESILTSGGDAAGSEGSVSYSIGQAAYTIDSSNAGIITKGVQQPYELFSIGGIPDFSQLMPVLSVYPNPTNNIININIDASVMNNLPNYSYMIFDINGNLIKSEILVDNETVVSLAGLAHATYFLKVFHGNLIVKNFKIIKTQ